MLIEDAGHLTAGDRPPAALAEPLIAVDWGTSRRRAYLVSPDGRVADSLADDRGVLSLERRDYPAEVAMLRSRFGDHQVVCAGMVGADIGWSAVPYVPVPATAAALAAGMCEVAPGVRIVPGVAQMDPERPDVMRGEETLVLGALAAGLLPSDALIALPGTHNKWVTLAGGAIVDMLTVMTGEIFALLKERGTLVKMMQGAVEPGAAFLSGVDRGARGDAPLAALFQLRAGYLLGTLAPADAASFASGLLIGADLAASPGVAGRDVHVLAAEPLTALYAAAIDRCGGRIRPIHDASAFAAGVRAICSEAP